MPIVKRTVIDPTKTQVFQRPAIAKKTYYLPTEPIQPVDDLGAYSWLFYGAKKIGKTTLASCFPNALFMMFEPGAKALSIHRVTCNKWIDALGYLDELERQAKSGALKFKTIVIDTGFEAYEKCKEFVCEKEDIDYPRENNFGKDWNKIKVEFRSFHNRIAALELGLIVLCHETYKEQQDFKGNKYDQVVPLLSSAANDYFRAVIDNLVWYHYRNRERFLLLRGNDHAAAGVALQADRFFKAVDGSPVYAIPLGSTPQDGYKAIITAFHNKQLKTFKEEVEAEASMAVRASVSDKIRKGK